MSPSKLEPPPNPSLPLFVYGLLKPGMPAFERIRTLVELPFNWEQVEGTLYVRDGLPLLYLNHGGKAEGTLLTWKSERESEAYGRVCDFEPREHYSWTTVTLTSGAQANTLIGRYPQYGNPQPLDSSTWRLTDDPAFGEGLQTVRDAIQELQGEQSLTAWQKFFRSQMAYLLLWSIVERLSALCLGPGRDPGDRVKHLHDLPGMAELVHQFVKRTDRVSDSRNPKATYTLNACNAKQCFQYYYQVRSNLSHRGKGVHNEFHKVQMSLEELCSITEHYIKKLADAERQV
jgi:hypothetical protein